MKREYHKWWTHRLGRDMELLAFGHAGARVIVFPARMGRFYDFENWGLVDTVRAPIDAGWLQLFCVDSVDEEGLYSGWVRPSDRIHRHARYEDYILSEVLPLTRDLNPNPFLIAHGCSLGAYHAVNIALRHPHLFGKVVALSGRYDLTAPVGPYRGLFDGHYDDTIYFHTPSHYLPNLNDPRHLDPIRRMEITLAVGAEDPVAENNRHLEWSLREKGARVALHHWPGEAHKPRYWRQMVSHYL
jgi:esterase/lipase superfamily enzyme